MADHDRIGATARPLIDSLAGQLAGKGAIPSDWREPFAKVARHEFIPDRVWILDEQADGFRPLNRADDPDAWWRHVYSDEPVVTQVDNGDTPDGELGDTPTSSASMPSLVLAMLSQLDLAEGHNVLEIGTGAGYNAALLATRLGDGNVTTIEVDPALADQARNALAAAGYHPHVITGDGTQGHPPNAPYHRIIATCSVRRIPYAWIRQASPGAVIVSPWGTPYSNNALVRLTVGQDGTASGPFVGGVAFMWLRGQQVRWGRLREYIHHEDQADKTTTRLRPDAVTGHVDVEFAIGVQTPNCQHLTFHASDGSGEFTLWLFDAHTGAWAAVDYKPDAATCQVEQYGPRRLWDEVEAAYTWWDATGRPERERFGLTVTPERQYVWHNSPDSGHTWPASDLPG